MTLTAHDQICVLTLDNGGHVILSRAELRQVVALAEHLDDEDDSYMPFPQMELFDDG